MGRNHVGRLRDRKGRQRAVPIRVVIRKRRIWLELLG
jgi:hypothetical protein